MQIVFVLFVHVFRYPSLRFFTLFELKIKIKAALINICIGTINQVICVMREGSLVVTNSQTIIVQLWSFPLNFIVSLSSLFWFYARPTVLIHFHCSHQCCFETQVNKTAPYLLSTKQQTGKISN